LWRLRDAQSSEWAGRPPIPCALAALGIAAQPADRATPRRTRRHRRAEV